MLVVVNIIYLMINISGSLIELMGVAMGNETKVAAKQNYSDLAKRLFVMPGHFVVYRIGLLSGGEEGQYQASVQVSTEFEELSVPFRFRVAKGSLSTQAQHLSFEPTFPVSGLVYSCACFNQRQIASGEQSGLSFKIRVLVCRVTVSTKFLFKQLVKLPEVSAPTNLVIKLISVFMGYFIQ